MSLVDEKHEWPAVRVRETFLEYFKERGHTFGMFVLQFSVLSLISASPGLVGCII